MTSTIPPGYSKCLACGLMYQGGGCPNCQPVTQPRSDVEALAEWAFYVHDDKRWLSIRHKDSHGDTLLELPRGHIDRAWVLAFVEYVARLSERVEEQRKRIVWLEDGLRQADSDFVRLGYRGIAEGVRGYVTPPDAAPKEGRA